MGKKQREREEEGEEGETVVLKEENSNVEMEFRDWYVNQITACFGGEIEALRKQQVDVSSTGPATSKKNTEADLNALISILRTGESNAVFDALAKSAVVESFKKHKRQAV